MPNPFFAVSSTCDRYRVGPLKPYLDSFAESLKGQGYLYATGQYYIREAGRFSAWLMKQGLDVRAVSKEVIHRYLMGRRKTVRLRLMGGALRLILEYLHNLRIIIPHDRPRSAAKPFELLISRFKHHLAAERGLCPETIRHHVRFASQFLSNLYPTGKIRFSKLTPEDIRGHVLRESRHYSRGYAKNYVCSLRVFLRFLRFRGDISRDLATTVPSIPYWRLSSLPVALEPREVKQLLSGCLQSSPNGLRDRAILLLMYRLGLRAVEVQRLTLDDIEWESGYLSVRGKGGESHKLPLPYEVGLALVQYLRHGRPLCSTRHVFVRSVAPHTGFGNPSTVSSLVHQSMVNAGISRKHLGSHTLRHTFATDMLRSGASLQQIGQILRHRSVDTTAIYAKVDLKELKPMVQPWPGGRS